MAYKLKEQFKGKSILSMRRSLDSLKQHHIKNLSDEIRDIYFEQVGSKTKKKKDVETEREI